MDKVLMVLMLTALAACPFAALLLALSEALGWRRAEYAVPYVFATAAACLLAAVIVYMFGVIYG